MSASGPKLSDLTPPGGTASFDQSHPLFRAIVANDIAEVSRLLAAVPALALLVATGGASRREADGHFVVEFGCYVYAGDTPLHLAGAGHRAEITALLLSSGADVRARNRRGSEPLHYASVGQPGSGHWDPAAQVATIVALLAAGADPNAPNEDGATPLHRAIRTRCADAVGALIKGGADVRIETGRGSTALRLAEVSSGRGGSGSVTAREEQARIAESLRAALAGERES